MLSILVAEDEYFLADDLALHLRKAGAAVIGPVARLDEALRLLEDDQAIDAAVLDLNLRGRSAFEIADRLRQRALPFLFVTGYGARTIPPIYDAVPHIQKPVEARVIVEAVLGLLDHKLPAPEFC